MKRYIFVFVAAMVAVWSMGANNSYTPVACKGSTITLTADSADNADFFQWYKDGVKIEDATSASLDVEITDDTQHTYSVTSRVSDPQVGNNLFANGSFESTTFDYGTMTTHTCSDYGYRGVNPNPVYGTGLPTTDIFFICQNKQAHQLWGDFHDNISAADGNSFAVFDAKAGKRAWYAQTATNPNLKLKAGREYIFSYSAVNINHHDWNRTNKASYDNPNNWTNVYCYIWDVADGNREVLGNWPGMQATKEEGSDFWTVELPERAKNTWKLIWNNGNGQQTGDWTYANPTSYKDTIDWHPAKLVFKVKDLTTNMEYPLATIDLDCGENLEKHEWIRKQATFTPTVDMNNVEINVTDLTSAEMGNDFGLDHLIFQHNNYDNSRAVDSTIFIVKGTTPSVSFSDQTISSTDTTVTARVTAVSNADYPVVATIKLNGENYTMSITSATASDTLTLQSALTTGNYTATVTFKDAKGCSGTSSFEVSVTGKPSVSINPISDLCLGDTNSITVSFAPSANAAQYKYCVKEGSTVKKAYTDYATIPSTKSFTVDITGWDAGKTYTVCMMVKGAEESGESQAEFTINALPSATLTAAAICEKDKKFVLRATSITESPTYSFVLDGKTYTGTLSATNTINLQSTLTAKTYSNVSVTLTSASGCEKIVKFSLKVNPVYSTAAETASTCQNKAYTWEGHTGSGHKLYIDGKAVTAIPTNVAKTITVVDSMKTVGCGCDSVATLKLTINPTYNVDTTAVVCDSFTWHGVTYTSTPTDAPTHNYHTITGCDSIVTLKLTINKSYQVDTTAVECDSFTWHGVTYTSTPTDAPTYNYGTVAGCDSIVTLHLTINKSYQVDTTAVECDSFTWHGVTYTSTPTEAPTHNYGTKAGCDSIVTLHLTINKSYKVDTTAVECDSFTWHGVTYMSTPTEAPTHNYGTKAGCDSIVTLYLTVNKSKTSEEIVRNCGAYTWEGVEYTTNGDYMLTLEAANGCDSVVTLHLTVLNDSLMYTKWGNLVLCADRNRDIASYQWYINRVEVPGATGQYMLTDDMTALISVRAITQSGDTLYSCEKTFAEMTTSPDQSKEEYTLPKNTPVRVYTISGRLMGTAEDNVGDVVSHLPAGIYILRWEDRAVRWVVY